MSFYFGGRYLENVYLYSSREDLESPFSHLKKLSRGNITLVRDDFIGTHMAINIPERGRIDIIGSYFSKELMRDFGVSTLKDLEGREINCFQKNEGDVIMFTPARYDTDEDFSEAA